MSDVDTSFGIDFLGGADDYGYDLVSPTFVGYYPHPSDIDASFGIGFMGGADDFEPVLVNLDHDQETIISTNSHSLPAPIDIYDCVLDLPLPSTDTQIGDNFFLEREKKNGDKAYKRKGFFYLFKCCFGL